MRHILPTVVSPIVINWHVTEACNFRCCYCYAKWQQLDSRELIRDPKAMGQKLVDTLVYTSPINGFMDQTDANNVGALLRMLPVSDSGQFGPLDNVYFLCTHAHTVASPTERRKVLDLSAVRLAKNLELLLNDRGDRAGASIGAAELRQRFFTFSADNPEIRVDFEKAFAQHLTGAMPSLALKGLDRGLLVFSAISDGTKS